MSSLLSWIGFKKKQPAHDTAANEKEKKDKKGKGTHGHLTVEPLMRARSTGMLSSASPASGTCSQTQGFPVVADPASPVSEYEDDDHDYDEEIADLRTSLREMVLDILHEHHEDFTSPLPVNIAVATFNVGEKIPRSSPEYTEWLTATAEDGDVDLIAVGLQEVDMSAGSIILEEQSPKYTVWEGFIAQQLDRVNGEFSKIGAVSMAGLLLLIFAKERIAERCSNLGTSVVRIGDRGYANKGAVAVRLTVAGRRVLFVNSHLDAHTEKLHRRNKGYARILSEMRFSRAGERDCVDLLWPANPIRPPASNFPPSCIAKLFPTEHVAAHGEDYDDATPSPPESAQSGVRGDSSAQHVSEGTEDVFLHDFDYVFWFGDLNYRLWNIENNVVRRMVRERKLEELSKYDQLRQAIETATAFAGFEESPIAFPPTYKYDCGSDNYDSSAKQRVPSWTDRVLFLSRPTALFPPPRHEQLASPSNAVPIGTGAAADANGMSYIPGGASHLSYYSCNESLIYGGVLNSTHGAQSMVNASTSPARLLGSYVGSHRQGGGHVDAAAALQNTLKERHSGHDTAGGQLEKRSSAVRLNKSGSIAALESSGRRRQQTGDYEGSGPDSHIFIEGVPPQGGGLINGTVTAHGTPEQPDLLSPTAKAESLYRMRAEQMSPVTQGIGQGMRSFSQVAGEGSGHGSAVASCSPIDGLGGLGESGRGGGHARENGVVTVTLSVEYLMENPVLWVAHANGMLSVYTAPTALRNAGVCPGMRLAEIDGRHPRDPREVNALLLQSAKAQKVAGGAGQATVTMCFDVTPPPPLDQNVLQPLPGTYQAHRITLSDHRPVSALFRIHCTDFNMDKAEEYFQEPKRHMAELATDISELVAKKSRMTGGGGASSSEMPFTHRRYDSGKQVGGGGQGYHIPIAHPSTCPPTSTAFGDL